LHTSDRSIIKNREAVRMKKLFLCAFMAVSLAGCASFSPSVPPDYSGPLATVQDTVKAYSDSKADFFYVSHVDGRKIESSWVITRSKNYGNGMSMKPFVIQNQIPARPTVLNIVGKTEYAAPILSIVNTVYEVTGTVEFTPEPNKVYVVRGDLGENYSAVWLEEETTHQVVGKKIEVNGSAKLGIFQK
jgi:hypothetical protein